MDMAEGLEKIAEHIKEHGLPSPDEMRAQIEANDEATFESIPHTELAEYTGLFNRFKAENDLTDDEMKRMGYLSDKIERVAERIRASGERFSA